MGVDGFMGLRVMESVLEGDDDEVPSWDGAAAFGFGRCGCEDGRRGSVYCVED